MAVTRKTSPGTPKAGISDAEKESITEEVLTAVGQMPPAEALKSSVLSARPTAAKKPATLAAQKSTRKATQKHASAETTESSATETTAKPVAAPARTVRKRVRKTTVKKAPKDVAAMQKPEAAAPQPVLQEASLPATEEPAKTPAKNAARKAAPRTEEKKPEEVVVVSVEAAVPRSDEEFYRVFEAYLQTLLQHKGQKMEKEVELAKRFGVTRYKIRKALDRFDRTGLLVRVKHAGSEVAALNPEHLANDLRFRLRMGCGEDEMADARQWFLNASCEVWAKRSTPALLSDLEAVEQAIAQAATEDEVKAQLGRYWQRLVGAAGNRVVETFAGVLFAVTPANLPAASVLAERAAKVTNALRKRDKDKLRKALLRFFREETPADEVD